MHIDMTMKTVLQIHGLFKYTAAADLIFLKVEGWQRRPQDLGGGGKNFFADLGICMSRSDMLRMAMPCTLLGGFGGIIFLKRCNLVRFRVYFDQI